MPPPAKKKLLRQIHALDHDKRGKTWTNEKAVCLWICMPVGPSELTNCPCVSPSVCHHHHTQHITHLFRMYPFIAPRITLLPRVYATCTTLSSWQEDDKDQARVPAQHSRADGVWGLPQSGSVRKASGSHVRVFLWTFLCFINVLQWACSSFRIRKDKIPP